MQFSTLEELIYTIRGDETYNRRLEDIVLGPTRSDDLGKVDKQKFENISQTFKLVDQSPERIKWELVSKHNLPTLTIVRDSYDAWSLGLHHPDGFVMLEEYLDSRVQIYLLASLWAGYLQQWYRN